MADDLHNLGVTDCDDVLDCLKMWARRVGGMRFVFRTVPGYGRFEPQRYEIIGPATFDCQEYVDIISRPGRWL